jgi:transposase
VVTATFGTTTAALLTLHDWLLQHGVTEVALESTGQYWKPVYYVLEDAMATWLVNAQHLQRVPGRKSDVSDSAWLAQLLEAGLLTASFIPPPAIRDLRDLTRFRKAQMQDRTREVNRLQAVLEDAGVKLSSVAADVMGRSGRAILEALLAGTRDPAVLAELARGRLRTKRAALQQALTGRFRAQHAFLLQQSLEKIDAIETVIAACSTQLEALLVPFTRALTLLTTIPGVKRRTAEVLIAETGADMRQFPSAAHLCSWSGLCPGREESAGKRRSGRLRPGNRALRTALIEAASAACRTRGTALAARYHRIKRHRGHKRAVVAVAHHLLVLTYHLLTTDAPYQDLGYDYFAVRQRERSIRRHVHQLEHFGYKVTLEPAA